MDEATRQQYETQSKELRVKIKAWEVGFYNSHNGKKPGRGDIKISGMSMLLNLRFLERRQTLANSCQRFLDATYKEYQKFRDILDGKILPPAPKDSDKEDRTHRKRPSPHQPSNTPSTKRFKAAETPSSRHHAHNNLLAQFTPRGPAASATALTPSLSRKLFSPAVPTSIGPTPQRDGRVLGLFDALPFKDVDIDSPCRPTNAATRSVTLPQVIEAGKQLMIEETPRKARAADDRGRGTGGVREETLEQLGHTPSSRHKRHHQGQQSPGKSVFATPLKPHDGNRVARTPGTSSSVSKLQFQTPAFLRRIPMPKISEGSDFKSPEPIRLPRKPLLRGLSSVVADLRKLQEEQLDDELDALRELENEHGAESVNNKPVTSHPTGKNNPLTTSKTAGNKQDEAYILAADTERQNMTLLGGFDDEGKYDSAGEENAGLDRSGQPLRVYKKKGQKRTTRRSNMKPVRARRPTTTTTAGDEEDADEEGEDATTTKTQPRAKTSQALVGAAEEDEEQDSSGLLSGSDFAASDDEDELAQDTGATRTRKPATKSRAPAKKTAGQDAEKLEAKAKKPARKVNELAHANFKRLKLRNHGSKGGPGYNSRFRRRR